MPGFTEYGFLRVYMSLKTDWDITYTGSLKDMEKNLSVRYMYLSKKYIICHKGGFFIIAI